MTTYVLEITDGEEVRAFSVEGEIPVTLLVYDALRGLSEREAIIIRRLPENLAVEGGEIVAAEAIESSP